MKILASLLLHATAVALFASTLCAEAADWPMWRCNASRTADTPEKLPAQMNLRWVREYPARVPVWEDPLNQDLMSFDTVFEPVVSGNRMFIGFNDADKLAALDIQTGRQLWAFYADGPVRLAPACWQGKVYFASDDGCLYCVRADDGALVWKFRGGPSDRKVLGNSRLISSWPARGGPVIRDGVVYFAASIWPFMGTFIHALDAATGKVVWVNDGTGAQFIKQPHNAPAFAGVAPQGSLVATEKFLLVPGGRSIPAAFDRATGKFLYFSIAESGKGTGGSLVMANEKEFFVHTRERGTRAHDLATGKKTNFTVDEPVLGPTHIYCAASCSTNFAARAEAELKLETARQAHIKARNDLADARDMADAGTIKRAAAAESSAAKKVQLTETFVSRAKQSAPDGASVKVIQAWKADKSLQWEIQADGSGDLIRAGDRLYAAGSNTIVAIEIPKKDGKAAVVWSQPVQGTVRRLLAANGMLFAVTLEGRVMAFGLPVGGTRPPAALASATNTPGGPVPPSVQEQAREIIERTGAREGYAFVLGLGDGRLIAALAAESKLHLIGVDADAAKVDRLRRQLDAAGLYGKRVALLAAKPDAFGAPPYIASLIVAESSLAPAALRKVYESLRPYGGSLWIAGAKSVAVADMPKAKAKTFANAVCVVREGALPGAADWTHQYGDVANTVKSDDSVLKLPIGLLWFGGNTHMDVLPRHGHGPSEQVIGGRLFIEGMDCLSARDVYTGRVLWKTVVPGLNTSGVYHDNTQLANSLTTLYSQRHMPGANARGSNFVATEDKVYIAVGNHCAVLDAASGAILRTIPMPGGDWGYIGVCGDVLLGGADFARFNKRFPSPGLGFLAAISDFAASRGLVAFNRHTGALLWRADARHSFVHNGIVAGSGRVYCLDRLPRSAELKAAARGEKVATSYRIAAFDLRSGKLLWENTKDIFGSWLSYSKERDLLLQAGASASDRLKDEAKEGMAVLRAKDGSEVWRNTALKYAGPCILHHDLIITTPTSYKQSAGAYSLLDGKPHLITNPLTGEPQSWRVYRTYGCNTPIAAENLMTFRSGAAGFYDLQTHAGTGNLGGFKSGCSANLVVANGVLNAPDYTRTCSCPYQNQTSLALVSMPEAEMWTYNFAGFDAPEGSRIARVGINLGAPGDHVATDGTLWLEYPSTGSISPQLPVTITGASTNIFRRHTSAVSGDGPAWVFASGLRDIQSIVITPQTLKSPLPAAPAASKDEDEGDKDSGKNKAAAAGAPIAAGTRAETATASAASPAALPSARYTVRLYFMEPDNAAPGRRVFDVLLQGQPVLKNFDIVKAAGAANRGVVKEFKNVLLNPQLEAKLQPCPASNLGPVLCGVELILEKP
ncbi:MAG: PQQ-binding-like beta-propeller repeat protein [Verrucomicrobia bacterium]|nr:PQQ-binding-like beta-propeller repeat protein [Verrucomicrobiota bacterium]